MVLAAGVFLVWLWWRGGQNVSPVPLVIAPTNPPSPRGFDRQPAPLIVTSSPTRTNQTPPPLILPSKPTPEALPPLHPEMRTASTVLEAQIAMLSAGISSGPIDGSLGSQTRAAVRAFQLQQHLLPDGELNEATKQRMYLSGPTFTTYQVSSNDLSRLMTIGTTWIEKSEQEALEYESVLELVAEKYLASQTIIRSLNLGVNWTNIAAGTVLKVPNAVRPVQRERAAVIKIQLGAKSLQAFGTSSNLLAHFPCSIAQKVEKRPVGQLSVAKVARNPNYVFDPAVYPESPEAQAIGRKLVIPPGPNNPVGTAWIGLDRPGYGIHGTPKPEQVGRTESHGCFRLANWNAEFLFDLVWVGLPVVVEP